MKYFKLSEFKKDPGRVDPHLMDTMDELRGLAGVPIKIHVAWSDSGHSKRSYHYRGLAVDFHFCGLSSVEQFACIRCFPQFHGIGFYPWWNSPGWHVDFRVREELFWLSPAPEKYIYTKEALISELTGV